MKLSGSTKIHELLTSYPFLEEFLISYNPKFKLLGNRAMRATVGRVASLRMVASTGEVDLAELLGAIAEKIREESGEQVVIVDHGAEDAEPSQERLEVLKQIISELHDGGDVEAARQKFALVFKDVGVDEIAEMEQQLVRDGLAVEEVQRLCDVHAGAFKHMLDEHEQVQAPAGHPVATYLAENEVIVARAERLGELVGSAAKVEGAEAEAALLAELVEAMEGLSGIDNHYVRKENQLFPLLERHGITGPTQVMWGVHDEIRAGFEALRRAVSDKDLGQVSRRGPEVVRGISEMVYKENKILLPLCMENLDEAEWQEVRRGEDELGYAFAEPGKDWTVGGASAGASHPGDREGLLDLDTGRLTLEQINLMLTHLPVDISFVDENDEVRYYSAGKERHFPRSPAVIGRKVQNCHPPGSVNVVQRILESFRSGKKDVADFWIHHGGKLLFIRYFAMRDGQGAYRGCLEVGQDVTGIRELQGEQRLLAWED